MATQDASSAGAEDRSRRPKNRILLVGSTSFAGVKCVEWFSGPVPNAADFDAAIINGASLAEIFDRTKEDGDGPAPLRQIEARRKWLYQLKERLRKLIKTRGTILAVVTTERMSYGHRERAGGGEMSVFVTSHDWMPLPIALRREAGVTVRVKREAFQRYMSIVKDWSFYLELDPKELLDDLEREHSHDHIEIELEPIAVNRQDLPIAATVSYSVHERDGRAWTSVPYERSGNMHLLPRPTTTSAEEGLRILLEDFYALEPHTPEPEFVKAMCVPGEDQIEAQIKEKSAGLAMVRREIDALGAEKARKRSFLALVYEKGIQGLQQVAQQAFGEMGLRTWDADPDVSDEFMVGDGVSEALVEVKGHRKSASKEDVRQLDESLDEYEKKFRKPVKGILVVNAWCEKPVEDRDQAGMPSFPDNVVKRAEAIGAALVSGVELYNALCAVWEGRVTGEDVFSRLLNGRGVTSLV